MSEHSALLITPVGVTWNFLRLQTYSHAYGLVLGLVSRAEDLTTADGSPEASGRLPRVD